jgi:hypothetical protein
MDIHLMATKPPPPGQSINEPDDPSRAPIRGGSINEPATAPQRPVITALEPDSCAIGDPDFTLYIQGENFTADSVIHFAGHDEPTTHNADGTLSTGVKPSLWGAPAAVPCIIRNGQLQSEPATFTFTEAAGRSARPPGRTQR